MEALACLQLCGRNKEKRRISEDFPDGEHASPCRTSPWEPAPRVSRLLRDHKGAVLAAICHRGAGLPGLSRSLSGSLAGGSVPPQLLQGAENADGGGEYRRANAVQKQSSLQPSHRIHAAMEPAMKCFRVKY